MSLLSYVRGSAACGGKEDEWAGFQLRPASPGILKGLGLLPEDGIQCRAVSELKHLEEDTEARGQ